MYLNIQLRSDPFFEATNINFSLFKVLFIKYEYFLKHYRQIDTHIYK